MCEYEGSRGEGQGACGQPYAFIPCLTTFWGVWPFRDTGGKAQLTSLSGPGRVVSSCGTEGRRREHGSLVRLCSRTRSDIVCRKYDRSAAGAGPARTQVRGYRKVLHLTKNDHDDN